MIVYKSLKRSLICWVIMTMFHSVIVTASEIKELHDIQNQIKKAHKKTDYHELLQANETFEKLQYEEIVWERQAKALDIKKWPDQNWQQNVGGYLFYPEIFMEEQFFFSPNTAHLIARTDMIWAFAIVARHKNPLGKYYLAKILGKQRGTYDKELPDFLDKLYEESITLFKNHFDHPDICYILGENHHFNFFNTYSQGFNAKKADEFYEIGAQHQTKKGHRNKLQALINRTAYKNVFQPPSIEEYLELGRKGYGPAYVNIVELNLVESFSEKINYLEEAIKCGFYPAFLNIGILYETKEKFKEAKKYYLKAGEKGIGAGYIHASNILLKLGNLDSRIREKLQQQKVTEEDLALASKYLKSAGQANDPKGWYQLALMQYDNNEEQYTEALIEAVKMGLSRAYYFLNEFFPDLYNKTLRKYGLPSHGKLYQNIENFLVSSNDIK